MTEQEKITQFLNQVLFGGYEVDNIKQNKPEAARLYEFTIFDVFKNLTENEIAIGRESGIKILKHDGDFIDLNGNYISMKENIMTDLYAIEEMKPKLVSTDMNIALDYYANGETVRVKYNDEMFIFDHKEDLVIPFDALFNGEWFIEDNQPRPFMFVKDEFI